MRNSDRQKTERRADHNRPARDYCSRLRRSVLMNLFVKIDTWTVDHVAQPIVNWGADHDLMRVRLAQLCYIFSIIPGSIPIMHHIFAAKVKDIVWDWYLVEIIILFGAFFYCHLAIEEGNDNNVWMRPKSFFVRIGTRFNWWIWTCFYLIFNSGFNGLWSFSILSGCYILAARPRPPARKKEKTPFGALISKQG